MAICFALVRVNDSEWTSAYVVCDDNCYISMDAASVKDAIQKNESYTLQTHDKLDEDSKEDARYLWPDDYGTRTYKFSNF